MTRAQAICYVIGFLLLVAGAVGIPARVSLALLGAASLALGFTLPTIATLFH